MAAMVTEQTASTTGAHQRSHMISCCSLRQSILPGLRYCQTGIKGRGARWTQCVISCVRMLGLALSHRVFRPSSKWRGNRGLSILLPHFFYMHVTAFDFRKIRQALKRFQILSAQRRLAPVIVMTNRSGWQRRCYRSMCRFGLLFRATGSNGTTFLLNSTVGRPGHGSLLIQRLTVTPEL